MDELRAHLEFFSELGVDGVRREPEWRSRSAEPAETQAPTEPVEPSASTEPVHVFKSASDALAAARTELGDCIRCKLHTLGRKQIVFGVGNPNADLMFVGEAPGADEDIQGEPFVGRAGQLLTKIIEAIDLRRDQVYICNILKCRPPANRNPEPDEIASCQPFLFRQIASVRPAVICALGTFGAQTLLSTREPISRLRGEFIDFRGAKLMATFHPAYLLRNPAEKRKVWEDMQKVRDYLRSLPS